MPYVSAEVTDLIGKTCSKVTSDSATVTFYVGDPDSDDCEIYCLNHHDECCESVYLEDIAGDITDLVGSPILMAHEEVSDEGGPPDGQERVDESYTWTFYKFATTKGYVTFRWYGSSNGYYSESVSFDKIK